MSDIIYFVTENDIKENSTISYAVEDKLITNSIIDAQNIDIQYLLGSRLMKKLQELVKTNDIHEVINADYKTLLDDYVVNALFKAIEKRVILKIWVKIRNTGVVQQDNENSTPVEVEVIDKIRREISNDYEYYANLLRNYLCEVELEEYSNYNPDGLNHYEKPNKDDNYFNGFVL
jgi:hypothetical protein